MKTVKTFVFLFLFIYSVANAQSKSKQLISRTWYTSGNFTADTFRLYPENSKNLSYQINFSPNGRMILVNLKTKQQNSSYFYNIQKSSVAIFYDTKDSIQDLNFYLLKNKKTKGLDLVNFYSMRYKKNKTSDRAPVNKFALTKGKKSVSFDKMDELTVYRMKKGIKHDSIEIISKGTFQEIRSDTLILNVYQYSEHNFYKLYPDTNHYFSETLFDTLIQIKSPINEITKIQAQREKLTTIVNTAAISALSVFFISFPLAITVKSSEYGSTFSQIAAISALSTPLIVSVNMLFSKQTFHITPTKKKKTTWQLNYKK